MSGSEISFRRARIAVVGPFPPRAAEPAGDLFARFGIVRVSVVIAGAHHERGLRGQRRDIPQRHRDLHLGLDDGRDVEEIAGIDHQIEGLALNNTRQPVPLLERVVEVGDMEDLHVHLHSSANSAQQKEPIHPLPISPG